MNTKRYYLMGLPIAMVMIALLGTFHFLSVVHGQAVSTVLYVAPGGNCGDKNPCYANIQSAVDAAQAGDEILIAGGVYTGVNHSLGLAQMAVITKTVTLRGGYAIDDWEHSLPVTRPTILDAQNAGRVFYITGPVSPTIENLSFVNGNASGLGGSWRFGSSSVGGGMYVISANILLSNTIFDGNLANVGGGIYAENSHFFLLNSTIVLNTSPVEPFTASIGGGLFTEGGNNSLVNNRIENNRAEYGGGLSFYSGRAELSHNRIQDNFSSQNAGGVLYESADGFMIGNVIRGNTGGGISLIGNVFVFDNTISQNSGDFGAGIALFPGNITLVGNTISGNQSDSIGGGIAIYYNSNSFDPTQKILAGNLISGNIATTGGGLWLESVRTAFIHNEIIGNQASENGGGLYIHDSEASLDGDKILKNIANQNGGGIAIDQYSIFNSTNLILAENMAAGQGSSIFIQESSMDLAQATIANNPGNSGICIDSGMWWPDFHSVVTMTNTIVAGHTTGITASQNSTITINGILWSGNQTNIDGLGTYIIKNTVDGAPAFTSDYHIGELSAARDTGVPSGVFLDIDTEPRPYGKFDLGADEFWPLGILKRLFLPVINR